MNRSSESRKLQQELFGIDPNEKVTRGKSLAGLISPGRGFMAGFDFTMQAQVGCPGGCGFCYVRASWGLAPQDVRDHWSFDIRDKQQVGKKLTRILAKGTLADKTLYWSGVTDPYGAPPAITKEIWHAFLDSDPLLRPRRIVVQTRFVPTRDLNLIRIYNAGTTPSDGGPAVRVSYSINTDRQELIDAWELRTPGFQRRMQVIGALRAADVSVVPTLSPLAFWNNLPGVLQQFKTWGVNRITTLFFKDQSGVTTTPKPFKEYLKREHPDLFNPQWQTDRLAEMHSVFGAANVSVGQRGFSSLAERD